MGLVQFPGSGGRAERSAAKQAQAIPAPEFTARPLKSAFHLATRNHDGRLIAESSTRSCREDRAQALATSNQADLSAGPGTTAGSPQDAPAHATQNIRCLL